MKHIFTVFIVLFTLLNQCSQNNKEQEEKKEPHYVEVEEYHINWSDLFVQEDDTYYVYVYSIACVYCSQIREKITDLAKKELVDLYFVYPSDDITFINDEEKAYSSIGASKIEDVYIYTTPTLMKISDKIIEEYTRNYDEINAFLDSYLN